MLLIDGAANQTFTGAATPAAGALPNLQIAKSGGTLTLAGTLRTGRNWTYTSGTVDPGSQHAGDRRFHHATGERNVIRLPGRDRGRRHAGTLSR